MTILALGLLALVPAPQGTAAQQGQSGQGGGIMDRLTFDAEGRMRGEATWDNVDATTGNKIDDRYRGRFRFRFGAKYALMDDVTLVGRLSTSSDGNDANNPHWDFGDGPDGFDGSNIVMDRYYLDWAADKEAHVVVGKQPNAFNAPPIFGEFLWDNDISPAGVSASWKPTTGDGPSFDARVAGYVATEVAANEDPKMLGGQANVYVPIDDGKLQLSTALYDWGDNQATAVAGNQGNSSTTANFQIWETFASGTIQGGPMEEMTGYLQFMDNLDDSDKGWVVGGQLGPSAWKKGNYNVFALFYQLDGDAVFSPVAQDDTPVAGTGLNDGDGDGMDGIVLGGQYFLRDNVGVKLWVLTSNASGADDDPFRLRIDFDFRLK